jgi:hypothetical protein
MLRKKDRVQFPERQIIQLLQRVKSEGKVTVVFQSPQLATRFRFLLYAWRNLQRATEYQGLEPELAEVVESLAITVDGPVVSLHGSTWDWIDQALVEGKPLREWMEDEELEKDEP